MKRKDFSRAQKLKTLFSLDYENTGEETETKNVNIPKGDELAFEVCEVCGVPTDEYVAEQDGSIVCSECSEI